jgi:hypothetical protein
MYVCLYVGVCVVYIFMNPRERGLTVTRLLVHALYVLCACVYVSKSQVSTCACRTKALLYVHADISTIMQDAKEVMDEFLATQTSPLDPDDPQASYLLQVCICIPYVCVSMLASHSSTA